MQVFPQLRKLEEKYSRELTVIGVHSAKFTAEKETANLRLAVLRYDIEHPVVNDRDFQVWQQYAIRAWPTLMFIDPAGKIVGKHEGEITADVFDKVIGDLISVYDGEGVMDRRELDFKLEREKEWERPLSFPGKVLADAPGDRLIIADSNHNRIVVTTLAGNVIHVIGSGERGFADGPFDDARFYDPQGLAISGERLYVADTKNHAIRLVDLQSREVTTLAGTGEQATSFHDGGEGRLVALNSPWDLALAMDKDQDRETLYIAMAGFHQLWRLDLRDNRVRPHAGSGRERIVDGSLATAQLAQPSGLVTDGHKLFFTDSETSAIRSADLIGGGEVKTIVGTDLFTFGDVDGAGDEVRLQHPVGLDVSDGVLYVADTYNNKIKRVDPVTRVATHLIGSGQPGHCDGPPGSAMFHEPGGISVADGKLYVADTNNHLVRVASLDTLVVETLEIKGIQQG